MKNFAKAIKFILWIIVIILIFITINIIFEGYRQNFFNEFTKAEYNLNTSTFARDSKVTYKDNVSSYKIESNTWNDAMFYKEIAVEPNTAYKVTCMVKQEMARVNVDILGIRKLKWSGMGEFNSDDHYIYSCGQQSLRRNGVALTVNKRVQNAILGYNLKNDNDLDLFPRQTIQYHSNPSLCPSH